MAAPMVAHAGAVRVATAGDNAAEPRVEGPVAAMMVGREGGVKEAMTEAVVMEVNSVGLVAVWWVVVVVSSAGTLAECQTWARVPHRCLAPTQTRPELPS